MLWRIIGQIFAIDMGRGVFRGGEGGRVPPPIVDWVDFLRKKRLCWDCSLYQKCSVDLKYAKMRWRPGLGPGPRWGNSRRSPRPLSRLGRGTPPPQSPLHCSGCLWRLDSRAFGAQLLCPQCKILATPLNMGVPRFNALGEGDPLRISG